MRLSRARHPLPRCLACHEGCPTAYTAQLMGATGEPREGTLRVRAPEFQSPTHTVSQVTFSKELPFLGLFSSVHSR